MLATVRLRIALAGLLTSALVLALPGCGGGSGSTESVDSAVSVKSEETSAAPTAVASASVSNSAAGSAPAASAPTVKTQVRFEGPITGFGSVIINNVRFNDNGATIQDEDIGTLARADLRLGTYVVIEGQTDSSGAASASRIAVIPAVRGRIEAIDAATGSLTVLRQTIRTDSSTVFEGSSISDPLEVGDFVEVHGVAGNGSIRATLVERKSGTYLASARGVIFNLNREAQHFCIGPLLISYRNATFLPSADALENGVYVSVRATREPQGDRLEADIVRVRATPAEQQGDAERIEFKGIVESPADGEGRFWVSGVKVELTSMESWPKGGFVIGQQVLMRGAYRGSVFVAERIATDMGGPTPASGINQLLGTVADRVGKSFTVNGVAVDASQASVDGGDLDSLGTGAFVEVRGTTANAPDGTVVRASEVRIRQRPDRADTVAGGEPQTLYGAIYEFVTASQFKLNGQTVDASTARYLRGTAGQLGNGVYVELRGAQRNGVLVADEVEFKRLRAGYRRQ